MYVDGKTIGGIYPRILRLVNGVLAVVRCRPDGSVLLSPDGRGGYWSDEVTYYTPAPGEPRHAGMQAMALIGPNTILVIVILNRGGWRAEGVPITVTKMAER